MPLCQLKGTKKKHDSRFSPPQLYSETYQSTKKKKDRKQKKKGNTTIQKFSKNRKRGKEKGKQHGLYVLADPFIAISSNTTKKKRKEKRYSLPFCSLTFARSLSRLTKKGKEKKKRRRERKKTSNTADIKKKKRGRATKQSTVLYAHSRVRLLFKKAMLTVEL